MGTGSAVVIKNTTGTLFANAGFSSSRGVTLGGGSDTIDVASASTLTLSSQLAGSGNLVKGTSAGTLLLSSTNGFAGSTTINGGKLANGVDNALPTTT